MSISECRWNLRAWCNLLRDVQNPENIITVVEISDWLARKNQLSISNTNNPCNTKERLLTLFEDVECKVICSTECHLDLASDCQKRIPNLFDGSDTEWWCPSDEATIQISKFITHTNNIHKHQ